MQEFFDYISGFFEQIWDIIQMVVEGYLTAYEVFQNSMPFLYEVLTYIPSVLLTGIFMFLALAIVRFIVSLF